ncbi:MAG: carbohydrate ABC transporter permease [Bacillota bacterium]
MAGRQLEAYIERRVGVIWKWIFDPSFGILNYVLVRINLINEGIAWLGDPRFALLSTIVVKTWVGVPFIGLMLLAGLQAIPESQYEAAIVDGANGWQVFRFVTLPNLRHVITTALTLDFIWTMRSMATVYVLTRGGPVNATRIIPIRIYEEGFEFMRFGTATAISVLLFCILIAFMSVVIRTRLAENRD